MRQNTRNCDLSDILPDDLESKVKEEADISMGTEISETDISNIKHLCQQVCIQSGDSLHVVIFNLIILFDVHVLTHIYILMQ